MSKDEGASNAPTTAPLQTAAPNGADNLVNQESRRRRRSDSGEEQGRYPLRQNSGANMIAQDSEDAAGKEGQPPMGVEEEEASSAADAAEAPVEGLWEKGAGQDESSVAGNISNDESSAPSLEASWSSFAQPYGGARDAKEITTMDPNFYGLATQQLGDSAYQDLPVAEIRYNEETNKMDVTTEPVTTPALPTYTPSILEGPEAPVWEQYMQKGSGASTAQMDFPDLPIAVTPARLLRDTKVIFDFQQERLFQVGWAALPEGDGNVTVSSSSKVTLDDMMSILPHPEAYFSPSLMEWVVIAPASRLLRIAAPGPSPRLTRHSGAPLDLLRAAVHTSIHEQHALDFFNNVKSTHGEDSRQYKGLLALLKQCSEDSGTSVEEGVSNLFGEESGFEDALLAFFPQQSHFRQAVTYSVKPGDWTLDEPTPFYRLAGEVLVEKEAEQSPLETEKPHTFQLLTSFQTDSVRQIFRSQPGLLPSILDERLLLKLRETRTSHPPPGVTDTAEYFVGALHLILRILSDALSGVSRPISTTSKIFTGQLGWDEVTKELFQQLGWTLGPLSDQDDKLAIQPPVIFDDDGRPLPVWRQIGRAWLELYCWAEHCKAKMGVRKEMDASATSLRFAVTLKDAEEAVYRAAGWDPRQMDLSLAANPSHDRVLLALTRLGVNAQDSDATLKRSFLETIRQEPEAKIFLLSQIEYLHIHHRKDSMELPILLSEERSRGAWTFDELEKSFALLGVEGADLQSCSMYDDQFIAGLYEGKVKNSQINNDQMQLDSLRRALAVITYAKGNPPELMRLVETQVAMTLSQAYTRLEVSEEVDDEMLSLLYQARMDENPKRSVEWTQALHTIALARNSESLLRLATGDNPQSATDAFGQAADPERPAGLNNIGNTCYLNSLLQYLFSLRVVRERVLEYAEQAKDGPPALQRKTVANREVTKREAERSHKFVIHLAALFQNMISFPAPAVTPERELAYLALVSADAEERDERMRTQKDTADAQAINEDPNTERSSGSNETDATLVEGTNAVNGVGQGRHVQPATEVHNSLMQVGAQQDVSECLDNIMFQLEVALGALQQEAKGDSPSQELPDLLLAVDAQPDSVKGDSQAQVTLLDSLFLGQTAQRLQSVGPDTGSQAKVEMKKEVFKVLPINVLDEEGRDIYDGLDSFFDTEVFDNRKRSVSLVRPPPVLQVQLQRAQFDRKRGRLWKAQAHLETPETIHLDRYCDSETHAGQEDPDLLKKRLVSEQLRQEASELSARASFLRTGDVNSGFTARSLTENLRDTADMLRDLKEMSGSYEALQDVQIDPSVAEELQVHAGQVAQELKQIEARLKEIKSTIKDIWKDEKRHEYILISLFMHRGEATHGHYFLNQRKLPVQDGAQDIWFKYNDSVVTRAEAKDALRDPTSANPYLVCYVRKDLQEQVHLVETLKRRI